VRGEVTNLCEARVLQKSGEHVTLEFLITPDQGMARSYSANIAVAALHESCNASRLQCV
jgi:hypothetical protein